MSENNHGAMDEIIDPATGEVSRREVPVGPLAPEPTDLGDPVPFPFPGNDPTRPGAGVAAPGGADAYADTPDPDDSEPALARGREARVHSDLEGLSFEQLLQAGYTRDEASRIRSGRAVDVGVQPDTGAAVGPVAGELAESHFRPPSDDEIHAAAARGIGGTLSSLYATWKDCQACPLAQTRLQVVLGSGNPAPTYVFSGQAPGPKEDQHGGPFVGPAGNELTAILNAVEINRAEECYLMNTVCCRPIDPTTGRVCPPSLGEMAACRPRFTEQLKILLAAGTVKVIVLLGKEAYVDFFYKTEVEKGTMNMNSFRVRPKLGWQDMRRRKVPKDFPKVYFTYHPSYILRNGGTGAPEYPAWKADFMAIKRWAADGLYIKPRGDEILV